MAETTANLISSGISACVVAGLDGAGMEIVEDIQARISDQYPPASKPGESPHRRSGNLQRCTDWRVVTESDGRQVSLIVDNAAFYAEFLRSGTRTMGARDFFGPGDVDRYLPRVIDAVVNEINDRYGK